MTNNKRTIDLLYFKGKTGRKSFYLESTEKANKDFNLDILVSINI